MVNKYEAIVFDYGGTLGYLDKSKFLEVPQQIQGLIASLHHRKYLLGIISNSNQLSDSHWVRSRLQKYGILAYFEATLFVFKEDEIKPNPCVFRRMLDFLKVDASKALFVGDSERCDGGSKEVGMDFLHVKLDDAMWIAELEDKLKW